MVVACVQLLEYQLGLSQTCVWSTSSQIHSCYACPFLDSIGSMFGKFHFFSMKQNMFIIYIGPDVAVMAQDQEQPAHNYSLLIKFASEVILCYLHLLVLVCLFSLTCLAKLLIATSYQNQFCLYNEVSVHEVCAWHYLYCLKHGA